MDPMDDDIFYPDDGGGGGAQPGYYGQPPSTRPTLTSHQIQPEPNPPGCPISEATRFVQLQPPQCPMPSQGIHFNIRNEGGTFERRRNELIVHQTN